MKQPEIETHDRVLRWRTEECLAPWPVRALQATLGSDPGGNESAVAATPAELPALWHWLYFLRTPPRATLGHDGHPLDPELTLPGEQPRRMFAAARVHLQMPLRVGELAEASEAIIARRDTQGSSGPLRIVTFEYRYLQRGQLCVREERDIIYRLGGGSPPAPAPVARSTATWTHQVTPDPAMLMRFSALTFNAHRIHYDQIYAQQTEGYPERVVHGPLVAMLLADLVRANSVRRIRRFEFRARSPLFVNAPITLCANPVTVAALAGQQAEERIELRALSATAALAMEATAWLAD